MADNVEIDPGEGGAIVATDEVAGIHYQINKLAFGAPDIATIVSAADPLPVSVVSGGGGTGVQFDDGDALDTDSQGVLVLGADGIPGTARAIKVTSAGRLEITVFGSVDTELPAPAVLADATSNPSVPSVGTFPHVFNGTTWDRIRRGDVGGSVTGGAISAGSLKAQTWSYGLDNVFGGFQPVSVHQYSSAPNLYGWSTMIFGAGSSLPISAVATSTDGIPTNQTSLNVNNYHRVFNGTDWDRARAGGTGATQSGVGVQLVMPVHSDGTSFYRSASSTVDNASPALLPARGMYLFDGASFDRARSADAISGQSQAGWLLVSQGFRTQDLKSSATHTTSGQDSTSTGFGIFRHMVLELNITAASGTTPTLDVYIDTQLGISPATFVNIAHFTQMTGTGRRYLILSEYSDAPTTDFDATVDLAAGTVRNGIIGDDIRVRWVIGGGTPSFTFAVRGVWKG